MRQEVRMGREAVSRRNRKQWQTPRLARLEAGAAENGLTVTDVDGAFSFS